MTAADQIRALAAQGTPSGEWAAREGDLEGGTMLDYVSTLFANRDDGTSTGRLFLIIAPNGVDPEKGETIVPALTGDGPASEANAVKAAAFVNAGPALADLIEVIDRHRPVIMQGHVDFSITDGPNVVAESEFCWCTEPWPCSAVRARDALVAALGVTEDVTP